MTEQQKNKRTRRRFLADMLFLGGGVTAAAMLAKTQFASPSHPVAAGAMEVPVDLQTSPTPDPAHSPECPPPMPGEPMPMEVEGEFVLPESECPPDIKGDVQVAPPPPKLGGKPIAPRPNGDDQ